MLLFTRRRFSLASTGVSEDFASIFVLLEHRRCWIHIHSPLIAQVAEVVVVQEALLLVV